MFSALKSINTEPEFEVKNNDTISLNAIQTKKVLLTSDYLVFGHLKHLSVKSNYDYIQAMFFYSYFINNRFINPKRRFKLSKIDMKILFT